jgi:hypothetical protein
MCQKMSIFQMGRLAKSIAAAARSNKARASVGRTSALAAGALGMFAAFVSITSCAYHEGRRVA